MRRGAAAGAALVACGLLVAPAAAQTLTPSSRAVHVVTAEGWSLARFLDDPTLRALAAAGGAAVMPGSSPLPVGTPAGDPAAAVREVLAASAADRVLLVVASTAPDGGLAPVIVAEGDPATLLATPGAPRALTSASTHRDGVVTAADLEASVAAFRGEDPSAGSAIEIRRTAPPLDLERRYLERSRSLPIVGLVVGLLVTAAGLLAAGLVARGAAPRPSARRLAWAVMTIPGLSLALLLAGHLPRLTATVVLPVVAAGTALVTWLGGRRGAGAAPATIGAVVLVGFAVEAATGWRGQLLAFLGASLLDGGRFYGLSNAFIGLLVGSALLVAWRLPRAWGVALLLACGVFAGFPMLGSNVGASVTAFAAAGMWWGIGARGRVDLVALVAGGAVAVGGTALVFVAHAAWPTATHVDGAIAQGGFLAHYVDRLAIGARMLREHPLAIIPALGGPALLALVLRAPRAIAAGFAAAPGARDVVLVAAVASLVAYVANDSGAAAAGLTWGLGLALAFWVSLRAMAGEAS